MATNTVQCTERLQGVNHKVRSPLQMRIAPVDLCSYVRLFLLNNHCGDGYMTLLDILSPESTTVDLKGETKEEIIAELVDSLAVGDAISDRDKVLQAVLEREKIMSTGIGDGIAIPHGKSDSVVKLVAALGTQRRGVDFEALDGEPAYVFFLLVSPANVSGPHIKALARISRLLKNDEFKKKLISASSSAEIIAAIKSEEENHPSSS